jgi:hypothetical protein
VAGLLERDDALVRADVPERSDESMALPTDGIK